MGVHKDHYKFRDPLGQGSGWGATEVGGPAFSVAMFWAPYQLCWSAFKFSTRYLVTAMVFPVFMYVWMWELDYKESWVQKNWCFWTMVLEKTLETPLDCKELQPVHPKGNQSWVFIGRTDAEAETPIFWPPDVKSWLIWKDPDVGKDWGQEEKGTTEDEMVRWHHWLNGYEFG